MLQYRILIKGQEYGPYTEAELREMFASQTIRSDAHYWYEGMPEWKPVTELPFVASAPPPHPVIPPQLPKQKQKAKFGWLSIIGITVIGFFVIIGFFVLILLAGLASHSTPSTTPVSKPATPKGESGYYASRSFIKTILKAPSSAKFSDILTDKATGWAEQGGDRFECWGFVDAQNSFGAMLRQKWSTQ
jgi:GYF domain 2